MSVQVAAKFFCNVCSAELELFDVSLTDCAIKRGFYTDCNHVLCSDCRIKFSNQCAVCKKSCRFMEIQPNMRPNYRSYFEPAAEIHASLSSAMNFQKEQHEFLISRLMSHSKHIQDKGRQAIKERDELNRKCQQAADEKRIIMFVWNKCAEEKRRRMAEKKKRDEEKKRREQIESQERQRQQQQCHGRENQGYGFGRGHEWTPGFDDFSFPETPQTEFGHKRNLSTINPNFDAAATEFPQFDTPFSTVRSGF